MFKGTSLRTNAVLFVVSLSILILSHGPAFATNYDDKIIFKSGEVIDNVAVVEETYDRTYFLIEGFKERQSISSAKIERIEYSMPLASWVRALKNMEGKKYSDAISDFETALAEIKEQKIRIRLIPLALYNIPRCRILQKTDGTKERINNLEKAIAELNSYIAEYPNWYKYIDAGLLLATAETHRAIESGLPEHLEDAFVTVREFAGFCNSNDEHKSRVTEFESLIKSILTEYKDRIRTDIDKLDNEQKSKLMVCLYGLKEWDGFVSLANETYTRYWKMYSEYCNRLKFEEEKESGKDLRSIAEFRKLAKMLEPVLRGIFPPLCYGIARQTEINKGFSRSNFQKVSKLIIALPTAVREDKTLLLKIKYVQLLFLKLDFEPGMLTDAKGLLKGIKQSYPDFGKGKATIFGTDISEKFKEIAKELYVD